MPEAAEITRRAKSNLAFALRILPKDRRDDMVVFYAFCRTMDDLADDPLLPAAQKAYALDAWKTGLQSGFENPGDLEKQVLALRDRRAIPDDLLTAIIDGCRMDLQPQRFQTWEDLSAYTWKVACAVGLVSIRIFGCKEAASEKYAIALGHALQLTNILRDVREDAENGQRIYLPIDDLARFGYSENDLIQGLHDERFTRLMEFEATRAEGFFREAAAVLPPPDRKAMAPAIIMGEIYQLLLHRMQSDGFRVFEKRYRISKLRKLSILAKHLVAGCL